MHVHTPTVKAVFLDRDDTLNECANLPPPPPPGKAGDLVDPALVELLPGVIDACKRLVTAGFRLIVITNQGGVARGAATLARVEQVNDRLRELLTPAGGTPLVETFYYCPFHPVANMARFSVAKSDHPWRKPHGGMIRAAADELNVDLERSWMVGDAERDVDAGADGGLARARCIRVGVHGNVPDLATAAEYILSAATGASTGTHVTLRALAGEPLADAGVRESVLSSAWALAERVGVRILFAEADLSSVHVSLLSDRFAALGFAAELRRLTNAWYESKFRDGPLWGTPRDE